MRRLAIVLLTWIILLGSALAAQAAPSIIWTYPANGDTNVDVSIPIWAEFDDAHMDADSFDGRITVDNGASFTASMVDWSPYDWLYVGLNSNLKYSTTYTVTVNKNVKNTSGTKMAATYSWSFTTMAKPVTDTTPPTVSSTSPVSSAVDVPVTSKIDITFSEVMDASTISTLTIKVNGGAVTGTVTLDASGKVATFTPSANLSSFTNYTVSVSTGVKDAAGNAMASAYSWGFRTMSVDATPPTVTVVSPIAGATSIDPSTVITATFSEAMLASTISTSTFTVSGGVTGTVSYDPATWKATFTPSVALANGTNYTVTVTTGVKDLAGNAMAAAKSWTFTTLAATTPPALNDYCQIPPYVTSASSTLKPNVLLIVDNSGSMYEFAYKASGAGGSSYDTSYNPATPYYGYFDSEKMFKYSSSYFELDTAATPDKTSFWSGNFLNWLTMRRIDVIRKVLVGGKTQPRSAGSANYLFATESPDRDFYKSYNSVKYTVEAGTSTEVIRDTTNGKTYNIKIYVGDQPPQEGLVLRYSDRINFGIMFYNDGYRYESGTNSVRDGGYVAVDIGATGTNLITQVENTDPSTWTPLGETLYEATRYFEATTSAYNGGTYSGKDPIQYKCQKNFVLILTDGESTKDRNLPGTNWGTGAVTDTNFNVKTWMDSIATQEGTTSQWNVNANSSEGTYYLEAVAYYAHNTDLRSSTLGKSNLPGKQNLTIYTVFAFDDSAVGRDLLKKTAKYGGFNDYDNTGKPDKTLKWDKDGNGIPDTYFEAQDGGLLASSLERAFSDILARVSAGTAASILSNSEGSGANVLQAVFFPKKYYENQTDVDWTGEMHNLWYYIDPFIGNSTVREDTDYVTASPEPPHKLNLGSDNVVNFYFNTDQNKTLVKRYKDANGDGKPDVDINGDGVADAYTFVDEVDPDYVKSIWRAGKQLWSRTSARTIYTQTSGSLTSFAALDTTQASTLRLLQAANKTEADKIVSYITGTDQSGYRSRTVTIDGTTGVWKLGDIVSSTPRLQSSLRQNAYNLDPPTGYGDKTYGDNNNHTGYIFTSAYGNRGMVYVGANDGMIHAFKLGILDVTPSGDLKATLTGSSLGEEQWTFIPKNALPYLRYLADPAYNHIYYVDGTTVLNDVSIGVPTGCTGDDWNCTKATDGSSWRTVLVGSMGLGGASKLLGAGCKGTGCVETPIVDPADSSKGVGYSSYFALDVTTPDSPSLLWEFGTPSLGFSTAGATFVKISAKKEDGTTPDPSKNGKWFAILASGPTGPIDTTAHQFKGTSNQNLTIYVLDLVTGAVAATIDTLTDGTKLSSAFAGSITGGVIDADRWKKGAAGHYQDDAIYIGYTQLSGTTWTAGGVLRLMTYEDPDPTHWKLSKVIDGIGPVTTNISRLQDRKNHKLWLYFGTGRYFYPTDDNSSPQRLYGIKEPCYTTADTLDPTCTTKKVLGNLTQQTGTDAVTNDGWYISLDPEDPDNSFGAERSLTDPTAMADGKVCFITFKPTSDVCSFGGKSYVWCTKYNTGSPPLCSTLNAKALVQSSTGSFEEIDLQNAMTCELPDGTLRASTLTPDPVPPGRPPQPPRPPQGFTGSTSKDPPPIVSKANLKPIKKILHIQER
jgi:type IV pilus assembly protein PilY1